MTKQVKCDWCKKFIEEPVDGAHIATSIEQGYLTLCEECLDKFNEAVIAAKEEDND